MKYGIRNSHFDLYYLYSSTSEAGRSYEYRFDAQGHMVTGWYNNGDSRYYYDEKGHLAEGLKNISGDAYYFENGQAYCNQIKVIDNIFYHFGADGKADFTQEVSQDNWVIVGENTYYVQNGEVLKNQWLEKDGYRYYFNWSGNMCKNTTQWILDSETSESYNYRFDAQGHMVTGWYSESDYEGAAKYYYDENGHLAEGIRNISGDIYYFSNGQIRYYNMAVVVDNIFYYFNNDGKADYTQDVHEDSWVVVDENTYYVQNGELLENQWLEKEGYKYYFNWYGKMYSNTSESIYDAETNKSYLYRFDEKGRMITGWYKDGDEEWSLLYYYGDDGRAADGITEISGETYYFDWDGSICKNQAMIVNNIFYHFGEDGKADVIKEVSQDGWVAVGNKWYYVRNQELVSNAWLKSGEYWYYFGWDGMYVSTTECISDESGQSYWYRFDEKGHMVTGWYRDGNEQWNSWYYYDENGHAADGLKEISGSTYYFSSGNMYRNDIMIIDEVFYHFGENGKADVIKSVSNDGWVAVGDKWYYVKDQELLSDTWLKLGGYWYYFGWDRSMYVSTTTWLLDESGLLSYYRFDEKGHMVTGWYQEDRFWYYYGADGHAANGITKISGSTYYFSNGYMFQDTNMTINKVFYHFGADGKADVIRDLSQDGWFSMDNNWYYAKDGEILRNQWLNLGEYWYYLDWNGVMYANRSTTIWDEKTNQSYSYQFDEKGHMVTGWYQGNGDYEDAARYYYETNGRGAQGIKKISDDTYYFENGFMCRNRTVVADKVLYHFGTNGKADTIREITKDEWFWADENWYYIKDGEMLKDDWLKSGDNWYYFTSGGTMCVNSYGNIRDKETGETYIYRFDEKGHMVTGWYYSAMEESWYYYAGNGRAASGLTTINGNMYYLELNGRMVTSKKVAVDGVLYTCDASGHCTKEVNNGWMNDGSNDWFYMESGKLISGWKKINNKWYYLSPAMSVGFETINEKKYYFDDNGAMRTGWIKQYPNDNAEHGCIYYYADGAGALVDGWQKINNTWYYFENNKMSTGVKTIQDELNAFDANGHWIGKVEKSGWIQAGTGKWYYVKNNTVIQNSVEEINGAKYYFDSTGLMVKNQAQSINGKNVYSGSDGKLLKNAWRKDEFGNWYYYDENNYRVEKQLKTIENTLYYFSNHGQMVRTDTIVDGKLYKIASNGKCTGFENIKTGWIFAENQWYYYENGKAVFGLKKINSKEYYFNQDGKMFTNMLFYINGKNKYAGADGVVVQNGWVKLSYGTWAYAENGNLYFASSIDKTKTINGKTYVFSGVSVVTKNTVSFDGKTLYRVNSNGVLIQKVTADTDGWKNYDGNWYYVKGNRFATGVTEINGKAYYFSGYYSPDGGSGAMITDELTEIGYAQSNGVLKVNGWHDGAYFENGRRLTGIEKINGKDYLLTPDYNSVNANPYYIMFESETNRNQGISRSAAGNYYYYDGKGNRFSVAGQNGWKQFDGQWYYLEDGVPVVGYKGIDGKDYVFSEYGVMMRGVMYFGGSMRYLENNNQFIKNDWKKIDGSWYYFGVDGYAVTGTHTIGGKTYKFDSNGKML